MRELKIGLYTLTFFNSLAILLTANRVNFHLFERYNYTASFALLLMALFGFVELFFIKRKKIRVVINSSMIGLYMASALGQLFTILGDNKIPLINLLNVFDFDLFMVFIVIWLGVYDD